MAVHTFVVRANDKDQWYRRAYLMLIDLEGTDEKDSQMSVQTYTRPTCTLDSVHVYGSESKFEGLKSVWNDRFNNYNDFHRFVIDNGLKLIHTCDKGGLPIDKSVYDNRHENCANCQFVGPLDGLTRHPQCFTFKVPKKIKHLIFVPLFYISKKQFKIWEFEKTKFNLSLCD
nr:hypothetical protein [Abalone asfa-like virus]